ncbi:MAG: hypothetical protein ACK4UN_07585 [Limisphaerales bacterium]
MIFRYASIRAFIYFMVATAFFAIAAKQARTHGPEAVFSEEGLAEQVQFGCVVLSTLMLLTMSKLHVNLRGILALTGTLGLFAAVRELNNTELYRKIFFFGAASWVVGGLIFAFLLWKFHRDLLKQLDLLLRQPAATLLAGGFVIVVGWAQVFAQSSIFPSKEVDRIVEEGIETAGYLLILFGVLELVFNLKRFLIEETESSRS